MDALHQEIDLPLLTELAARHLVSGMARVAGAAAIFLTMLVGVALAGVLALAYLFGLPALRTAENRAQDWLFQYGRPDPPPPSASIVCCRLFSTALSSVTSSWREAASPPSLRMLSAVTFAPSASMSAHITQAPAWA